MSRPRAFFKPLDAILILVLAAASAWGFLAFRFAPAGKAVVYVGNAKYGWYDLGGDAHPVDIPTGIGTVSLEIGGGHARVLHSPCPNQLCVRQGSVHRSHAELICMPARLLVVLEGGETGASKDSEPDAITY